MKISPWILLRKRSVSNKSCRENTYFMFSNLSRKSCRLWDNVERQWSQRGRRWHGDTLQARLVRLHAQKHTSYTRALVPTHTHAFRRQQWLRETGLNITLYVHCLTCLYLQQTTTYLHNMNRLFSITESLVVNQANFRLWRVQYDATNTWVEVQLHAFLTPVLVRCD